MAFLGARRRVLLVGGEGVALFGPTTRGVERETAISWEVPNFDQQLIDALTEQNKSVPVLILFDGADQTYRKEENIPNMMFLDRQRFIKRKLDLAFPSYPVRASILVKPAKPENRHDPQEPPFYLFVALPDTDRLDKVGDDLLEAGVPVGGFGLLPAESVGLVTTLSAKLFGKEGKRSRWTVLIGQNETGGLRQVVVKNGNLALTRMTPTSEAGTGGPVWVEEVMREFRATLTYIARFGYNADEGLDVIVICGDIEKQFFGQTSLPVTNFQCLTTAEALAAIGSKGVSLGEANFGDALHAAWAGRKAVLAAPIVVPSIHRIMLPRMVARVASAMLALGFLAGGFFTFNAYEEYKGVRENAALKQNQRILLEKEYEQEAKTFDSLPIKPEAIRGALAVRESIDNSRVNVTPTLNVLRRALDEDIKLSNLTFEHSAATILQPEVAPGMPPPNPYAVAEDRGTVKIAFRFTLLGKLELEQKVIRAERLLENLRRAFPGYQVKIVTQFGGVSRTGRFEGEAGKAAGAATQEDAAEFEMEGVPL